MSKLYQIFFECVFRPCDKRALKYTEVGLLESKRASSSVLI